ncbi:glycosyltransferase family 2 protein [Erwinia sp. STN24]|uniref:glycosyltransferase family 2 protein n=1 Tax=Erwinia sp. STN24 TaxID=3233996 RepID=UPI00351FE942
MDTKQTVAVLLCTYNGSQYIRRQLDSIITQSWKDWVIYASDDGSTDGTLDILKEYQRKIGAERFNIVTGPGKGFAWNFISLLQKSGDKYPWYAFCDQDDEWMPEKLAAGISLLSNSNTLVPAVYCGRTRLVDENDHYLGESPLFEKKPSFRNALVQSIAGGNTMLMNHAARGLVVKTPQDVAIVSHDWWIYIIITAVGGEIIYDPTPTIKYRQHNGNLVGSNTGWMARFKRIFGLLDGHFKEWIDVNLLALNKMTSEVNAENKVILANFVQARKSGLFSRVKIFAKLGLYRQTFPGTLGLFIAILLKKI